MPYQASCSRFIDDVRLGSLLQAQQYAIATDEVDVRRLRRADYGLLCSMFFSEAPLEVLALATDWLTWTFVLDDMVSDRHQGDPSALTEVSGLVTGLTGVIDDTGCARADRPMEQALADLLRRASEGADARWLDRFAGDVRAFVEGYAWEAENLALQRIPDLVDHIQTRRQVSGAVLTLDLVELSLGFSIPDALYAMRPVRVLMESTADQIMHVNDVFSLQKEIAHLDWHNNVHIVTSTLGLGLQDAVDAVSRLAASQIALHEHVKAVELPRALDRFAADARLRQDMARWTLQLERSMAGSLLWHRETHRYHDVDLWRPA